MYSFLKTLLKNLLVFILADVLSMLITAFLLINPLAKVFSNKDAGLGAIALIPVAIIYVFVAGILGGIIGVSEILVKIYQESGQVDESKLKISWDGKTVPSMEIIY